MNSSAVSLSRERRTNIVRIAASYTRGPRFPNGTRFVHQGRVPGTALDCGGVISCAALEDGGVFIQDTTAYSRQPWSRRLKVFMQETLRELDGGMEEAQAASVVLFTMPQHPRIQIHMGILDGEGAVIHAWIEQGRVCRSTMPQDWIERVDSVYDYWPLEAVDEARAHGFIRP